MLPQLNLNESWVRCSKCFITGEAGERERERGDLTGINFSALKQLPSRNLLFLYLPLSATPTLPPPTPPSLPLYLLAFRLPQFCPRLRMTSGNKMIMPCPQHRKLASSLDLISLVLEKVGSGSSRGFLLLSGLSFNTPDNCLIETS